MLEIDDIPEERKVLSEESRTNFIKMCEEAWTGYQAVQNFHPGSNHGFRGGQIEFKAVAKAHMKRDGSIVMWEFSAIEISHNFKYDV